MQETENMQTRSNLILRPLANSFFSIAVLTAALFAEPRIEFDRHAFSCGTVIEGKDEILKANFIVTNNGDEILKITRVRPGCGCTVVKFDSLIAPGKSSKIESSVNIKGYRSGPISKLITVTSNAKNEPIARLTIEAKIEGAIEISQTHVTFNGKETEVPHTIFIFSRKKDLKITDASFVQNNDEIPEWQARTPLPLKCTWTPTDSVRPDGYRVFKATIFAPSLNQSVSGEITITTNHPEQREIKLIASILK